MTTIRLQPTKPRNPLTALARLRRAGAHGPSGGSRRQAGQRALRRDLQEHLSSRPPSA